MVETSEQPPAPSSSSIIGHKRRNKMPKKRHDSKRVRGGPGMVKKSKVSQKMQKVYRKRAREYNSDEDENEGNAPKRDENYGNSDEDKAAADKGMVYSDDEDAVQTGITMFSDGCNAFKTAFQKLIKSHVDDETLGPVLAVHKKLVAAKLAEEVTEQESKKEAKKEQHLVREKGHVKPANFLDSHEKFLIGVATKGVVKLFNAVNKAQVAQKGLNPSRFKDAKALTKRRKEAFATELKKVSAQSNDATTKASLSKGEEDSNQPAWAPLQDTFMLTNSKLKDWDKMAVVEEETDI